MVNTHGIYAVLLFSCSPNGIDFKTLALVHLCGLICGHFQMPFNKFFSTLVIGKAIIKTVFQLTIFLFLFSDIFEDVIELRCN